MTPPVEISACMIVRDAADTLEACLKSIRPHVDELVVVDTGSIDGSLEIARRYADKLEVFLDCNTPEGLIRDFALARNRSYDLATKEWTFWLDSDDVIEGAEHLKKIAEQCKEDNVIVMLPYHYAHDDQGRCTCIHWRERLVRPRHRFVWRHPVHEVLFPIEPVQGSIVTIRSDMVRIIHRRKDQKEPRRNLRILTDHVAKTGESDVRALYYLGLEYGYAQHWGQAVRFLRRYTELSQWDDEKCLAMLELARIQGIIGDHESAIDWASKALLLRAWPEPYWRLGKSFYALAMAGERKEYNFRRARFFLEAGVSVGDNDTVLFTDPTERYRVHEFLNVCQSTLGDIDAAIESCNAGLAGMPENKDLLANLAIYKNIRGRKRVADALADMDLSPAQRTIIERTLSGEFQVELLEQPVPMPSVVPSSIERREPAPGKLDLVFCVGHQVEPWNPRTAEQGGIGGSETMAMHLAKRLAGLGHAVRVYGHCTPSMEGVYDDVAYLDATRYHEVKCDVMIASRKPTAVDEEFKLKAGVRILWVHDIHCGPELNMVRDLKFDRVLCLSQWHKRKFSSHYPRLDGNKIIVTRNGIDLDRFAGSEERDPHRVIYSSSPDRGLLALLDMWPDVRAKVSDATLHVFYGFKNWEWAAQHDEAQLRFIGHLKHLCNTLPGVTMRDRVSQTELAREFMRTGVWAYPTWFDETSCITAMEAQAAGCRIVTSAKAALNETVSKEPGHVMLEWDRVDDNIMPTPEYREKFLAALVEQLTNPWPANDVSGVSRFDLDTLAAEWDAMLTEVHADVTERVVPPFNDAEAA